jgi:hypothetical protein
MRRLWLVAAATVLILAGCGDDPGPAAGPPATTATTTEAPAATEQPSATGKPSAQTGTGAEPAAEFVSVVRDRVPEVAVDRRDDEIAAVARQACASLASGKEADALVEETRSLGTVDAEATDQATARELIKLAIDTVCPEQSGRVDEF